MNDVVDQTRIAPWSAEEVDALNRWQRAGTIHPFTCPDHDGGDRDLVATRAGWICVHCDYTQDWAHEMMFGNPPPSVDEILRRAGRPSVTALDLEQIWFNLHRADEVLELAKKTKNPKQRWGGMVMAQAFISSALALSGAPDPDLEGLEEDEEK